MKKIIILLMSMFVIGAGTASAKEQNLQDKMFQFRATEAVVWAITVYDLKTASYIRDQSKSSVDSNMKLKKIIDSSYYSVSTAHKKVSLTVAGN